MHCIFTRMYDDTNVWVTPERGVQGLDSVENLDDPVDDQPGPEGEDEHENAAEGSKTKGRAGRRKVVPLLGMLQWVTARRSGAPEAEALETVQLHVPSQVLPKASPC